MYIIWINNTLNVYYIQEFDNLTLIILVNKLKFIIIIIHNIFVYIILLYIIKRRYYEFNDNNIDILYSKTNKLYLWTNPYKYWTKNIINYNNIVY